VRAHSLEFKTFWESSS